MLDDISRAASKFPSSSSVRSSAVSSSAATTYSSPSACSPAASATATPWPASSSPRPTSFSSTSPPTTSTCAPKTSPRSHRGLPRHVVFVSHDRYFIDRSPPASWKWKAGSHHPRRQLRRLSPLESRPNPRRIRIQLCTTATESCDYQKHRHPERPKRSVGRRRPARRGGICVSDRSPTPDGCPIHSPHFGEWMGYREPQAAAEQLSFGSGHNCDACGALGRGGRRGF